MSCTHNELLEVFEFVNDEKRIKEFVCEECFEFFSSCPIDEEIAKTPDHLLTCSSCNSKKKKTKFRIIKEPWQEQLEEYGNSRFDDKKKRARA